ncbi:MAG: Spo0E family sporulation regulatory protein-aspartic acid phosphatase [Clostridium sp.]|nr:Spo0E family sporulation regulatory protein-aspartic acid phosphatase [Clostridium sp.]
MNQLKIQDLQTQLNRLIDKGDDYSKIYELSVKLDMLIVQYYNEKLKLKKGDCHLTY